MGVYKLSPAAVDAGLDGKVRVGLTIKRDGTVSDVRIYGGPMWKCGTDPKAMVEVVRREVKEHILATRFEPEMKEGKRTEVSVQLNFMLSESFKAAGATLNRVAVVDGKALVDVGPINSRATSLAKPSRLQSNPGVVMIQVLVDETGNVTRAGSYLGSPALVPDAVESACRSKFTPASVNGRPIPTTGILSYYFQR